MSTGSHGDNEVEVVGLGVTPRLVLALLEDMHIFGAHCFQVPSLCVWSPCFLCNGQNSAPSISWSRTQGCVCTVAIWKSVECPKDFGSSCSALICPVGDMEGQSKSRH